MEIKKYRVIKEGSMPDSAGGIFNCGIVAHPTIKNERCLVVRKERHHDYHYDSSVVMVIDKIEKLRFGEYDNTYTLKLVGYPKFSKCEDFRLFYFRNELYAIHTLCVAEKNWVNADVIKPVIAKVSRHSLTLLDYCELPYVKRNFMEKNWLPIVYKDELYLLYGLDPLRIYKLEGWSWRMVQEVDTGLSAQIKKTYPDSSMLSLSAIECLNGDAFLGFWHIRDAEIYKQGMFGLDMSTLDITHFTEPVIVAEDLEGFKPSCLYISDLVITDTTVEAWAGEADSHTMLIEIDKNEAIETLMASPYNYTAPLKIRFNDKGVGDCICALYAIAGWMKANPGRTIKFYSNTNHEVISAFRIPGIELWMNNNERVDVDLSSNEDYITDIGARAQYQKKLEGSFKTWYAYKLGVTPAIPNTDLLEPAVGYDDAILVFPYSSAWETRNWPKENWKELTQRLIDADHRVIVTDQYIARLDGFPGELLVTTSIGELLSIIKGAKVCVTNESGAGHMAGLIGTKCLVLSGGLDPAKVNDLTSNDFIYKKPLQTITVEEVFQKMTQLLGK